MRNWNAAKVFSYKEIKLATHNFKEVIGHGSFGAVYLGKLLDGKLVAVKVRLDKSQLGADSLSSVLYKDLIIEKSDVYSFGVVLLELICGREPLTRSGTPDSFNLVLWAKPYLQAGALEIVDESLVGSFDVESMRKAAKIAIRSVERDASQRPTIAQILAELKEAYSIQLSYLAAAGHIN